MPTEAEKSGVIRPEELYTLEELKRRVHLGEAALRAARRAGLVVHYKHSRGFVVGSDWINYILSQSERSTNAQQNN